MPISIRVDVTRRLRYAAASGVLTDADYLDGYGRSLEDTSYDPAHDVIFDVSGVESLDVTPAAIRRMADIMRRVDRLLAPGVRPRVAIVAPSAAAFGLARMYGAYRESQQSQRIYLVCRTMDEANRWLGLTDLESEPDASSPRADAASTRRVVAVVFRDPSGIRWRVAPRLLGRGSDPIPSGFEFTSEHGERRFLRWDPRDFFSPQEVDDDEWRSLLKAATVET